LILLAYGCGTVADQVFVLIMLEVVVLGILVYAQFGCERPSHEMASAAASPMGICQGTSSNDLPKLISTSVATVLACSDAVFQNLAQLRLASISSEIQLMAAGQLVFTGSESWRTAYERILRTPGLNRYFSVAWLRTEDYWRDAPGRRSIQLNYDLVELGLPIERIVILNDFFWAPAALLPAKSVCRWLEDQHKHGINLRLVRESEIEDETGLLGDFGVYGDRAVGSLDMDDQCRSLRFTLDFNSQSVQLAEERWRRLELFAVSFREVLDRGAQGR
jgi:hypothetical protein